MSLRRILIYCVGGILLTLFWVVSSFTALPSNAQRDVSGIEMVLVPALGWFTLVGIDRLIHHFLFGTRNVVRLSKYRPCSICPITGQKGEELRSLIFLAHAIGPVHVTIKYSLPILISRDAAVRFPKPDIAKLPRMMIAHYTKGKAIIYIKDPSYQLHFTAANEQALE